MKITDLIAETYGSVGLDLRIEEQVTIQPGENKLIFTTLEGPLSDNHKTIGLVCPRSSISKRGLLNVNSPGVIDADYEGKIGVVLYNLTNEEIILEKDERVAQILLMDIDTFYTPNVKNKSRTGGFGSTGRV